MEFNLVQMQSLQSERQGTVELMRCNQYTERFGLKLSGEQALAAVEAAARSLRLSGRLELNGSIMPKLIYAFCDSPFLGQDSYLDTLCTLTEIFYTFKNETLDALTDDELIAAMVHAFNGSCQGSLALLEERELDRMAHNLRCGLPLGGLPETDEPDDGEGVWDEYEDESDADASTGGQN